MDNGEDPLAPVQAMHDSETVTREGVIAWYRWYERKLPRMHPERSDADLIRTVALWMELTDRGGLPAFPYDYRSELSLPSAESVASTRPNPWWRLGILLLLAGIVIMFFTLWVGIALVILGGGIQFLGYRIEGGPTGIASIGKQGLRVLKWSEEQAVKS